MRNRKTPILAQLDLQAEMPTWTCDTIISFRKAVELLVQSDPGIGDKKGRATKLLIDHVERVQDLVLVDRKRGEFRAGDRKAGKLRVGELGRCLQQLRPQMAERFAALPALRSIRLPAATGSFVVTGFATRPAQPDTLPRCYEEIRRLTAIIHALQLELNTVKARNAVLEANETKRSARSADSRAAGKQGGRGNTK